MRLVVDSVTVYTDEVVVGTHHELVELGNPEGYIFRRKNLISASTAYGTQFIFSQQFDDTTDGYIEALHMKDAIEAKGSIDPSKWAGTYPVYGSQAYLDDMAGRSAEELAYL
jgi:hypothetical protein